MSLLNIITGTYDGGAAVLMSLPNPTTIVGSSDPNAPMLLRLANLEGKKLARRHDWQNITIDYTVAALATELQTALPSDFDRLTPGMEIWNRSRNQLLNGPTEARIWQELKAISISSGTPGWWRFVGNTLHVYPPPSAGETLAFSYVSNQWCQSSGGTGQTYFQADADTARIPEDLITLGIIWRWNAFKGFDYAEALSDYEREVERATSRDRGIKAIRPGNVNWDPVMTPSYIGRVN